MASVSSESAWSDGLQGAALEVASTKNSPIRVLAGPGTGKTFLIKRRVMRLLQEGAVPERILAVTFTRNAADSLVKELTGLNVVGSKKISAGTLHSFCFGILRRSEVLAITGRVARTLIGIKKHGTIMFEYSPMLEDIDNKAVFGDKRNRVKLIWAYEAAWARQQHNTPGSPTNAVDQEFEKALVDWLKFHRAMLVGEVVPIALDFLRNDPHVPELAAYDHIVVDEYQDLNKAEQDLIDVLSGKCNLVVVGDEDQSIYRFRYAHPQGVIDFAVRHKGCVDKPLTDCHRCPTDIVAMATHLIKHNHIGVQAYKIQALASNPQGEIYNVQWASLDDEALGIAALVNYVIKNKRFTPGDVMVLCPRRKIGYAIRDALKKNGIAAHSYYHEEELEEVEAQESFTLLRLLENKGDRVSLRFWLGCRSGDFLVNQYAKLRTICEESGDSPYETLSKMSNGELSNKGFKNLLARFSQLLARLNELSKLSADEVYNKLFPAGEQWASAAREIVDGAEVKTFENPKQLLDLLTRYITQPDVPADPDFVRVMSLHKSKGLASKMVIVAGLIESFMPFVETDISSSEEAAQVEEQRRLFYVAITRSREVLVLSSVAKLTYQETVALQARVGPYGKTVPSRFLRELGPQLPQAIKGEDWVLRGFSPY